jgi:hypothetical protein
LAVAVLWTLAIKVELYVRNYPVVLFQGCALLFLFDTTAGGWLGLFGAISCARTLRSALIGRFNLQARLRVLAFMNQYRGCRFRPIDIGEVLGRGFAEFLIDRSLSTDATRPDDPGAGGSRWRQKALASRAHALRVVLVEPGPGAPFPAAPTAFPLVIGGYIFLLDAPRSLRGAGKFIVLHELGHIAMAGNYYALQAAVGYAPYVLVVAYSALQTAPTLLSAFAWAVYTTFVLNFVKVGWEVHSQMADAQHESQADFFAFANLEPDDRRSAAAFLRRHPIRDTTLAPPFDEGRRYYLDENIKLIEADDDRLLYHRLSGATPTFVWIALAATAALGLFMRPQDGLTLTAEWAIMGGLTVWFGWILWRDRHVRMQIQRNLDASLLSREDEGETP